MAWMKVFPSADVSEGEMKVFEGGPEPILVCRVDGEIHAVQDTCTHDTWSLADGFIEDGVIECSLHFAKFCVRTGKVKALPACEALKVFPVKVDGDFIYINC